MSKSIEYEMNQPLWRVSTQRGCDSNAVTVTKIGRKWVYLSCGGRVAKDSIHLDGKGYCSPATLYVSEEAHDRHVATNRLLRILNTKTQFYQPPTSVSPADVIEAGRLIGIDLTQPEGD